MPSKDSTPSAAVTFAELMGAKRPNRRRCRLLTDPGLLLEVEDRRADLALASAGRPDSLEVEAAQDALQDALDRVKDATVEFVFESLSPEEFDELVAAHPPTKDQKDKVIKAARQQGLPRSQQLGPQWNIDTFPIAMVAATMVEPFTITEDQAREMWESGRFTGVELGKLFLTALEVQTEAPRV